MCDIRSVIVNLSIGNKTYNILPEHISVVDYSNTLKQTIFLAQLYTFMVGRIHDCRLC